MKTPSLALFLLGIALPLAAQNHPWPDHPWPDPVANHVVPYQSLGITHGPVLGQITESSVRVWIRTEEPMDFAVVFSETLPFDEARSVDGETLEKQDNTGWVTAGKLEPNTEYFYAVKLRDEIVDIRAEVDQPWPSFRTLPDASSFSHEFNPDGKFNFMFSVGACQRQRSPSDTYGIYANPPAFNRLWEKHRDDLFFHIVNGDYTYEETLDGARTGLEDNYKLYLERGRSLNRFLRHVPMFTMFNDHEVTDNIDGAGEVGLGNGNYLVRDPAIEVWEYYAAWVNDHAPHKGSVRFGEARLEKDSDVLHDPEADFSDLDLATVSTLHVGPFYKGGDAEERHPRNRGGANTGVYRIEEVVDGQRLRVSPALRESNEAPYSIGTHHYFDRMVGNCHFVFLDTRSERTKFKGPENAAKEGESILGATQKKWFLKTVEESEAEFIFIVSGDPWVIYHSAYHMRGESTETKGDGFAGYVHEREELIEALDGIEKPVMILTGDVHHPFAVQITDNVWEFLCSPINSANHPVGTAGLPPLGGWFDSQGRKVKVKWCGGYPDNVHYLRQRHTNYTVVQVNNIVRAGLNDGEGYQYLAYDEPQVVIRFHDGYTGDLLYAEAISTMDAKPEGEAAPKENRFGHWFKKDEKDGKQP
ncbi:MAG: alkaline phosphatase D family protein [Verrucomicrobiales bacterium]